MYGGKQKKDGGWEGVEDFLHINRFKVIQRQEGHKDAILNYLAYLNTSKTDAKD